MTRELAAQKLAAARGLISAPEPLGSARVWTVLGMFLFAFIVVGARMAELAVAAQPGPATVSEIGEEHAPLPERAEILDRNGHVLATNISGWSLHARPLEMADHAATARALSEVLGLDAAELEKSLGSGNQFVWIKKRVFSHEKQAVQDLGLTGLVFRERPVRVYPLGNLLSHVVGGVRTNRVEISGAEIVGVGGVELHFEDQLRQGGSPVALSIDRRVQAILHDGLERGIELNRAKGGSAVLIHVATGEIFGMASFPDFDPNNRPTPLEEGLSDDDPLLNRAAQGVYELGSVLKPIAAALAIDRGGATLETKYAVGNALMIGKRMIKEHYIRDHTITLLQVVQLSSNVGSALASLAVGGIVQQAFLRELGLFERLPIEVSEARGSHPIYPAQWKTDTTATVAYGHGLAITPVHLASAISTLVGDGKRVQPTLVLGGNAGKERPAVVSAETVTAMRIALRSVVQTQRGTGRRAHVAGYDVGGKTGTADKPIRNGIGYDKEKVISTFVSAFPMRDPKFTLVISLDEPQGIDDSRGRRHAGRTAGPIAREVIARIGALYGLMPEFDNEREQDSDIRIAMY